MSVLFPPEGWLRGDVIGVTAPSSGVPEHLHPRLELAIKNLKKRGYQSAKDAAYARSTKIKAPLNFLALKN